MSKPKSLRWTSKQKHIAKLLQQGATNAQISKHVKIDKSVVTKVKNALATGDIPENKPGKIKSANNPHIGSSGNISKV